ncbi:MAG TPA: chromosome partitioning protein ParB, partial [Pyrinomonadaceae bacterium]|nr:chromosome partitioning protein ParB [Pyrinomonadaceae bacterium]
HARTLLAVEDLATQRRIARKIIDQDLSVRSTERLVRSAGKAVSGRRAAASVGAEDANTRAAETKLRRQLGTKVRILQAHRNSPGKIEIEFYNDADLARLFDLLMPAS